MKRLGEITVVVTVSVAVLVLSTVNVYNWLQVRQLSRRQMIPGTPPAVHKILLPVHQIPNIKFGDFVRFTRRSGMGYWNTGTVVKTQFEDGQFQVLVDDGLWQLWSVFPHDSIVKIDTLPYRDPMEYTQFDLTLIQVNEGTKAAFTQTATSTQEKTDGKR